MGILIIIFINCIVVIIIFVIIILLLTIIIYYSLLCCYYYYFIINYLLLLLITHHFIIIRQLIACNFLVNLLLANLSNITEVVNIGISADPLCFSIANFFKKNYVYPFEIIGNQASVVSLSVFIFRWVSLQA